MNNPAYDQMESDTIIESSNSKIPPEMTSPYQQCKKSCNWYLILIVLTCLISSTTLLLLISHIMADSTVQASLNKRSRTSNMSFHEAQKKTDRDQSQCPQTYIAAGDFCYFVNFNKQTFDEHLAGCTGKGGYLVATTSTEEIDALSRHLKTLNVRSGDWAFFIGLKDTDAKNENYAWVVDGSKMLFSNWAENQPTHSEQRCVIVIGNPIHGGCIGQWDDLSCGRLFGAVCEAEKLN